MVVTIHLLIALNGGYVLFVLIFLLVELCLHLCHLLQLVHLALMAVGFQLVIVHLFLAVALIGKAVVFQFLVACQEMVFLIQFALTHHLLEVVIIFLHLSVEVAVVFLFFQHPLAFTLFIFDAPVTAAFQIFTFPVVVGAGIIECPFCLETGCVDVLLALDAHDFRDFLTRNLLVCKFIFEHFHFLLLDQTVLAEVFQGFELLFLGLCLADAFLTFEHLDEFLQLIIVEQLVFVDALEGMAQILCVLCRRNLLGVGLYFHSVAEFSGAVHEVEFLFCVIELAFYLTETLKVLVAVGDIQNLGAFYAEYLLVDGLADFLFQYIYSFGSQSGRLVVLVAEFLAQQGFYGTIEQLL